MLPMGLPSLSTTGPLPRQWPAVKAVRAPGVDETEGAHVRCPDESPSPGTPTRREWRAPAPRESSAQGSARLPRPASATIVGALSSPIRWGQWPTTLPALGCMQQGSPGTSARAACHDASATESSAPVPDESDPGSRCHSRRRSAGTCCRRRRSARRSPTACHRTPPCTSVEQGAAVAAVAGAAVPEPRRAATAPRPRRARPLGLLRRRRRWRLVGVRARRPRDPVGSVQHQVAVVLQHQPDILGALGIGVPDRLVRCVEHGCCHPSEPRAVRRSGRRCPSPKPHHRLRPAPGCRRPAG